MQLSPETQPGRYWPEEKPQHDGNGGSEGGGGEGGGDEGEEGGEGGEGGGGWLRMDPTRSQAIEG